VHKLFPLFLSVIVCSSVKNTKKNCYKMSINSKPSRITCFFVIWPLFLISQSRCVHLESWHELLYLLSSFIQVLCLNLCQVCRAQKYGQCWTNWFSFALFIIGLFRETNSEFCANLIRYFLLELSNFFISLSLNNRFGDLPSLFKIICSRFYFLSFSVVNLPNLSICLLNSIGFPFSNYVLLDMR
jgi:hypothetical protein